MKKAVRYSERLVKFIIARIEEGMTLAEICRKYPNKMPEEKTVHMWRRNRPDFKERYDTAYQTKMYKHMEEMMDLAQEPLPSPAQVAEKYGIDPEDTKTLKIYLAQEGARRRERVDVLKTICTKLMPKMVPDMSDKVKIDHEHKGVAFVLQDWSQPKEIKSANKTIEHTGKTD